jgi:hypothetical protein
MWFLVAISIGAYSASGYRYNSINQVSTHNSKVECQIAANGVKQQLNDFAFKNNTVNAVRLICVQGGKS